MRTPLLSRPKPVDPLAPPRSPFADKWWWASVVVIAVIVVIGAVALLGGHSGHHAPTGPAPSVQPSSAPTAVPGDGCAALGLPADDQTVPQAAPVVSWSRIGRVSAPSAAELGPAGPGLGRCYAHTPTGALIAAATFLARTTDPVPLRDAIEALTADGRGREVLLEQLDTNPAQVLGSGSPWQLAGFTFLQAGPDQAAVAVVIRGSSGGFAAVPLTLTWTDQTWLVVLPDDGSLVAHSTPLTTLAGYIPWQAG